MIPANSDLIDRVRLVSDSSIAVLARIDGLDCLTFVRRTRAALQLENLAPRRQTAVLQGRVNWPKLNNRGSTAVGVAVFRLA